MKIKRFFSQDMRTVIRTVREELGPDAVILSNNRVNGGVEIIAAVDYDESLFSPETTKSIGANSKKSDQDSSSEQKVSNTTDSAHSRSDIRKSVISKEENSLSTLISGDAVSETGSVDTSSTSFDIDQISSELAMLGGAEQPEKPKKASAINYYENSRYHSQSERQFYHLDDTEPETQKVSDTLYNTGRSNDDGNDNIWTQEPTLISMRNEISTLRGLLEQQLSGIAWSETERRNPIRAKLLRQLLELDLNPVVARKIADQKSDYIDYQSAWQTALTYMTDNLPVIDEDLIISGGVISIVGPTGAGKTTTLVKLASRYALRFGRRNVGLITIDNYRVGAHEQLKTYSKIFDIPLRVATNKDNLLDCINSMSDKHLILIDTAGLSHKDTRATSQFNLLKACCPNYKTILVMPVTNHRTVLEEIVLTYKKKAALSSCILTKLDETTTLGGAISVLLKFELPVSYYCDGQKVPDTLHIATAHSLINRSVLIARKTNQPLGKESIEQAFTGLSTHARI